jgi:hypothetical protein
MTVCATSLIACSMILHCSPVNITGVVNMFAFITRPRSEILRLPWGAKIL